MNSKIDEEKLAEYAQSIEGVHSSQIEMPDSDAPVITEQQAENPISAREKALQEQRQQLVEKSQELANGKSNAELHAEREEQIRRESAEKGIGNGIIPVESLPSKGLFYPKGTKIYIRSASLGDIKRWSAMNEEDTLDVMEKMESIFESCCTISFGPNSTRHARYKDILDLDRLYIVFAIHDWTFPAGKNDVQIKLSEKDNVVMRKENIKFIEFPEKLMNFYNEEKRCFSFPVENKAAFADTNGMMDIYLPSIGVSDWLRDYAIDARQRRDNIDEDFLQYASLLIPDWRNLTTGQYASYYYNLIDKTTDWGTYEWSLISKVRDIIVNSAGGPTFTYIDDGGVEREVPLSFRNGLKSLFQVELKIDL